MDILPKEPAIPLLAGYVYKRSDPDKAVNAFTEVLNRDPNVVTAYTNRGFVYNDLHKPALAAADFEESLKRQPNDAEAHMGLAFAEAQSAPSAGGSSSRLRLAGRIAGDSELVHTIRATAYGREGMLTKSAQEYRSALKFDPNDGLLYLNLGNIFFAQRRYHKAIDQLQTAEEHLPAEPFGFMRLWPQPTPRRIIARKPLRNIRLADQYSAQPQSTEVVKKRKWERSLAQSLSEIYACHRRSSEHPRRYAGGNGPL